MALLPAWHAGILGSATDACVIDYTHRIAQRKGVAIHVAPRRRTSTDHDYIYAETLQAARWRSSSFDIIAKIGQLCTLKPACKSYENKRDNNHC